MKRVCAVAFLTVCLASPSVFADVTIKQQNSGKGLGASGSGETTQYIKGLRMRTDSTMGGNTTTIIDAGAEQMISIDHGKKEATIVDMKKISAEIATISATEITASMTPTGQTRQIAGASCSVHDMKIGVPMKMGNDTITIVMAGPACLVKGAPGAADYAAFFKAYAEKNLFMDPRAAKGQPAQAKGMTRMYTEMAERGFPLAFDAQIKFEGSGMMASMMNKMGGVTMSTEVVSVATDSIPDSMFEVPAGYKTKKQ
jgi:opacity protein-like surface antigen